MRAALVCFVLSVARSVVGQILVTSNSGSCANSDNETCVGSRWGNCCSQNGFCGQNSTYCGGGCQSDWGACFNNASQISIDGGCGSNGKICLGSIFGNCCSKTGFCGSTNVYCGTGCQDEFGACGSTASNVTVSTTVAANASPSTTIATESSTSLRRSSATPTTITTTTGSASSASSTSPGDDQTGQGHSHSVTDTTGFKAGMAVMAVVIAAILVAALAWFFLVRRPRRRQQQRQEQQSEKVTAEPLGSQMYFGPVYHEKPGSNTFVPAYGGGGGHGQGHWGKTLTNSSQSELGGFPVSELPAHDRSAAGTVPQNGHDMT